MREKILVVDDEPHLRTLYATELESVGYCVVVASNGQQAIDKVMQENPELVVLDIRMPGMDGLEVLSSIAQIRRKLPIILYSAYASYEGNYTSWIADAYLIKSSDLAELKSTIRQLLDGVRHAA